MHMSHPPRLISLKEVHRYGWDMNFKLEGGHILIISIQLGANIIYQNDTYRKMS